MREIMLVEHEYGDWVGLYVDGQLVDQGHSFSDSQLLSLLGIPHEARREIFEGSLPARLADMESVCVSEEQWQEWYG